MMASQGPAGGQPPQQELPNFVKKLFDGEITLEMVLENNQAAKKRRNVRDGRADVELLDRLNRAVAQVLTRYSAMVMAATAPLPDTGNILEQAALNRMTMETESSALVSAPFLLSSPSPSSII